MKNMMTSKSLDGIICVHCYCLPSRQQQQSYTPSRSPDGIITLFIVNAFPADNNGEVMMPPKILVPMFNHRCRQIKMEFYQNEGMLSLRVLSALGPVLPGPPLGGSGGGPPPGPPGFPCDGTIPNANPVPNAPGSNGPGGWGRRRRWRWP